MIAGVIESLAAEIDQRWRRFEYDEQVFAELARDCLAQARPHAELDGFGLLRHACAPRLELRARHAAPGVLPLCRAQHFDIHAHFWLDDVAVPHDHGWAGAFHIIEGRSLNSYHAFVERERVRSTMRLGRLARARVELHAAGDSIAVQPGDAFIHGLHYLDRSGVAISVRSKLRERKSSTYLRPGLALGEAATDDAAEHALRALAIAWRLDEQRYLDLLEQLIRAGDRVMSFMALSRATQEGWPLSASIYAAGRELHGEGFDAMLPALEDLRAYQEVVDLRAAHPEPQLRALLAALHLSDDRAQLVDAITTASPTLRPEHDPSKLWDRVGGWLVELLVDTDEVELPPLLAPAFGRLARGAAIESLRDELLGARAGTLDDQQLEFLASARAAMLERPLYRALFS